MEQYRFDDSCSEIYSFVYDKFCSWFIELSKNILNGDDQGLKNNRAAVLKYSFRELTKFFIHLLHLSLKSFGHLKSNEEEF